MTTAQERVLEMVAQGKLSPAEADTLLATMGKAPSSGWDWAFNPLAKLSTSKALLVSAVTAVAGAALFFRSIRFDGALDVHHGVHGEAVGPGFLLDAAMWPFTALVFWGVALVSTRRVRFVDMLAGVGLARIPLVLVGGLTALLLSPSQLDPTQPLSPRLLLLGVLVLPLVAWAITLMVTGFRTATGLRGARFVTSIVVALVLAELLSKLLYRALELGV